MEQQMYADNVSLRSELQIEQRKVLFEQGKVLYADKLIDGLNSEVAELKASLDACQLDYAGQMYELKQIKKQTAQEIIQYIIDQGTIEIMKGSGDVYYITDNDIAVLRVRYGI